MKWNPIQSNSLRNSVPLLHGLSRLRIPARLLSVLLLVGSSVFSLAVAANPTGNITNDVASILAYLNALRIIPGHPNSGEALYTMPLASYADNTSIGVALQKLFSEQDNFARGNSYMYEIQRALYGRSGVPSQSQAIIPLLVALSQKDFATNVWTSADIHSLLSLTQKDFASNVWSRSDVETLLSLPRTNDLSTLELYVGGFVSPIGHMESILSDWGSLLTTQTDGGFDAWRVKDEDLISFLEDWENSLEDRLSTMGQGQSSIESYVGDLVSIVQTYTDDTADYINAIFNGADSFYSDFNDFALALTAQLEANFLGLSNGLSQIVIDLTPVVEAVQDVNQDLNNLRDETLGYPAGNSQFLMLTNILQKLVADPVQVGAANSNLISSIEVGSRAYSNEVAIADASVTELAEDDDTVPDWEEHRYTSNPLDQFSSSLERPQLMFRSFTTGPEQITGDTRITLFDGAFPIMGGQPRRSGNSVNLNISYGLTDTDVAVSQMVNKCGDIMGWVWDVCTAVLIGWLYKRFADYMSGPKLLTA